MDLVDRMLVACLSVWFIDQVLAKFRVPDPAAWVIQIIVIILAALFIVLGWSLNLGLK